MKCSYQDLNGNIIEVTCESYIHIPSGTGVNKIGGDNRSADLIHITEDFSFFKKTQADSIPLYRFAVDDNQNVFNSDELPALAQIGTDWKILDE
ncbi:hypothetical protein RMB12_12355 [Acinetobacter sp. V117_2]|uniref:hypothetical protein n=1 Tax=Acinetobacter sp. V117_2 TaxID=3072989 RepID=UPI00287E774F|nr:hypothetical protein [Acinetobacter sp. V117_2]MDS7967809.1 hypothetical protein [Acinetobacter sp. V117_2]